MVRGGLVGCGQVVEELHLPAWRAIPEVRMEAICDTDSDRRAAFARKHPVTHSCSSLDELLEKKLPLDFVSIATPGFTHYDLCRTAINAGLHVLVEKPLCLSLKEALDLQELAHRKRVRVCVAHTFRFRDPVLETKKALDQGLVGTIEQINLTHHGGSLFHSSEAPWAWQEQDHKVFLYELSSQLIDLMVYFAGPAEKVLGLKAVTDPNLQALTRLNAMVEHASRAIGIIDLQLFSSSNFTQLEIYGTANDIRIQFFPHSYRITSGRVNPMDELIADVARIWNFLLTSLADKMPGSRVPRRALPHYRLFRQFVDSLQDDSLPVPVSIESVLPTLGLLEQLGRSAYA